MNVFLNMLIKINAFLFILKFASSMQPVMTKKDFLKCKYQIGNGCFGIVYKSHDKNDSKLYKVFDSSNEFGRYEYEAMVFLKYTIQEHDIFKKFQSSVYKIYNLVPLEKSFYGVAMSNEGNTLSTPETINYLKGNPEIFYSSYLKGREFVEFLNSINIYHLEIKPANLCFNPQTKQIVFIDFGISYFRDFGHQLSGKAKKKGFVKLKKKNDRKLALL